MTYIPAHLGQTIVYPRTFDATLLDPIPRLPGRLSLDIDPEALPFMGWDTWQAFELGWLNVQGQGVAGVLYLQYDVASPLMIESKSLKLYLQSFHMTVFVKAGDVVEQITSDLKTCLGTQVKLDLQPLSGQAPAKLDQCELAWQVRSWRKLQLQTPATQTGVKTMSLDDLEFSCSVYEPKADLLRLADNLLTDSAPESDGLVFHFTDSFRSLCPVTGQPDFASIGIITQGLNIDALALGQYLNSFRLHQGFHEQCVEHIFMDILQLGSFEILGVVGRFTRRGGIDINPLRALNQASQILAAQLQVRQLRQ